MIEQNALVSFIFRSDLSCRARNLLTHIVNRRGFSSLEEIRKMTDAELLTVRSLGSTTLSEIRHWLSITEEPDLQETKQSPQNKSDLDAKWWEAFKCIFTELACEDQTVPVYGEATSQTKKIAAMNSSAEVIAVIASEYADAAVAAWEKRIGKAE